MLSFCQVARLLTLSHSKFHKERHGFCPLIAAIRWYFLFNCIAYCCDSMVFPIQLHHKHIEYYDIAWNNGHFYADIPTPSDNSVIFLCNFFGCGCGFNADEITRLKQQGPTIIYDHTHAAFNTDDDILAIADYHFASLRKWLPIASGALLHTPQNVALPELRMYPHTHLQWQGMLLKNDYLNGQLNDKELFFTYFHRFAELLLTDYRHYAPDNDSIGYIQHVDINGILRRRESNANLLHEAFKKAHLEFPECQTDFLFVPIFLPNERRNCLRQYLTDNNIYCPIHWPRPEHTKQFTEASKIYDSELSIICDQRYDNNDMERIINTINQYL